MYKYMYLHTTVAMVKVVAVIFGSKNDDAAGIGGHEDSGTEVTTIAR
jgi:hypothetical protein